MVSAVPAAIALALLLCSLLVFVNEAVLEPYMDEIFHVPQAQKYCQGRFGRCRAR
jgi:alpha-1,2-glucosyltransferase